MVEYSENEDSKALKTAKSYLEKLSPDNPLQENDYITSSRKLGAVALRYHTMGDLEPFGVSIDVTNNCNLSCDHCYQFKDEAPSSRNPELMSDEEWLERIDEIKEEHPFLTHATWVGGEPLIRWDLVKEGAEKFESNYVVTNGTVPIPDKEEYSAPIKFEVSLDGPENLHNDLRGVHSDHNVFQQAMENAKETTSETFSHAVITSDTYQSVDEIVEKAYGSEGLSGIRFSFYVPDARDEDDPLRLKPEERDEAVKKLLQAKEDYKDFIMMSDRAINYLDSEHQEEVFEDGCMLRKRESSPGANIPLDTEGEEKGMCVFDAEDHEPDCSDCGCTVGVMTYAGIEDGRFPNLHVDYNGDWEMNQQGLMKLVSETVDRGLKPAITGFDRILRETPEELVSEEQREDFWQKQVDLLEPEK